MWDGSKMKKKLLDFIILKRKLSLNEIKYILKVEYILKKNCTHVSCLLDDDWLTNER